MTQASQAPAGGLPWFGPLPQASPEREPAPAIPGTRGGSLPAIRSVTGLEAGAVFDGSTLQLRIPGEPLPKPRPRVTVRKGHAHGYLPPRVTEAVTDIRRFVGEVLGSNWVPLAGPLAITVVAYRRPPISLSKQRLAAALPTQRPDADNYLKLILDALSPGADGFPGIWADDAQICTIHAHKRYAIGGLLPGWDVRVDHLASSAAASPAPVAVSEYSNWQPPEAAARYLVEASWGG